MALRNFISLCEKAGQLKRVKAEVNWILRSPTCYLPKLVEEKAGPALL